MLFHSPEFLFGFLPVAVAGFFLFARRGAGAALGWLAVASCFFYGWWNPVYLPLLLGSLCVNFALGRRILGAGSPKRAGRWLAAGVTLNLLLLGVFKYLGFFLRTVNDWTGAGLAVPEIELPLGISFYTFTQIAYLVDTRNGRGTDTGPLRYGLFIIYFPHCIAGPIVHHYQLIPQFGRGEIFKFQSRPFAAGLSLFVLGLAKKLVLADGVAKFANPVFNAALDGVVPGFYEAWGASLAYSLQLYFDFSGYSDMASGLAFMIGLRFPANFNSPYKAGSMIEFWRRWHMTLSNFIRDYLYFPLVGQRRDRAWILWNVFFSMVLAGLWHGAGWTYILWGALHGALLVVNHWWRGIRKPGKVKRAERAAYHVLTFTVVVIAGTVFRAKDLASLARMFRGMFGFENLGFDAGDVLSAAPALVWIGVLLLVVFLAPNTHQLFMREGHLLDPIPGARPAPERIAWRPGWLWSTIVAAAFTAAVLHLTQIVDFIYFQF